MPRLSQAKRTQKLLTIAVSLIIGVTLALLSHGSTIAAALSPSDVVPPPSADVTIGAAGDIIDGSCHATTCPYYAVSTAINSMHPGAALALGDLSNLSGSLGDYTGRFNESWGRFKSIIHPVPGNHDYSVPGAANYYTYFGAAAHGPNGYYSYNLGNWHLVAVNAECGQGSHDLGSGACAAGSTQEKWLKADLAANTKPCTLAYWHKARYSSGYGRDNSYMSAIYQDLYNANAEIVLSGHSHDYERFAPQDNTGHVDTARGITQFVVGTGGASFTGLSSREANSRVFQNTVHGALKLVLHTNSYSWSFMPIAGKTFSDSGSANCH